MRAYFTQIKEKAMASLKKNSVEGRLRVSISHGTNQYWLVGEGEKLIRYLSKSNPKDMKLARQMAQRDYDKKVMVVAQKVITEIDRLEALFARNPNSSGESADAYETDLSMAIQSVLALTPKCQARRALICPHELTNEEYVVQWYERHGVVPPGSELRGNPAATQGRAAAPNPASANASGEQFSGRRFPEKPVFTNRGEAVRSKSEKIIADRLNALNIPYIYEYPLQLSGSQTIYPDFLILNSRTRREYILEHFGLMSDSEYVAGTVRKINAYCRSGFVPGKRFLFTMEDGELPLETLVLEKLLEKM